MTMQRNNQRTDWSRLRLIVHPDERHKERAAVEVKFKLRYDRDKRQTVPIVSHTLGWSSDGKDFRPTMHIPDGRVLEFMECLQQAAVLTCVSVTNAMKEARSELTYNIFDPRIR